MKSRFFNLVLACGIGCSASGFPEDFHFGWYAFVTPTVTKSRSENHLAGDPPTFGPGYFRARNPI